MNDFGFTLLSGGLSSRMGSPKALLVIDNETLLDRIARVGQAFSERLFSVNDPSIPTPPGYIRVPDLFTECGPMGGLHACLTACRAKALVVAPCDAPGYTEETAAFLLEHYEEGLDALILQDKTGRTHPLIGVYHQRCLPVFTQCLENGHYKLMHTLSQMKIRILLPPDSLAETLFINLNTPEEYQQFLRSCK